MRRAWVTLRRCMAERMREKTLQVYLLQKKQRIFRGEPRLCTSRIALANKWTDWAERSLRQKYLRGIEQEVQNRLKTVRCYPWSRWSCD
jgi:hypothetical protein